jgi:hypothetical protein
VLPPVDGCPSGGGNDGAKMGKGTVVAVAFVVVFFSLFFRGWALFFCCVGDSGVAEGSGTRLVLTMSANDLPEDHAMWQ